MKYNDLTAEEKEVIENNGTEAPYSGEYENFYKDGILSAKNAIIPCFLLKQNLMQVAAGLHLMKVSPML